MNLKEIIVKDLLGDYTQMLDIILTRMESLNNEETLLCDHICYRVETTERYSELKRELLDISELVAEAMVSGRPISIFKLNSPIIYKNLSIACIELPAPKSGSSYTEGWEHAEFVIKDLDAFISNNQELNFNTKAMGRSINPELGLKINDLYQVKFHPLHILDVIKKEEELGITSVN